MALDGIFEPVRDDGSDRPESAVLYGRLPCQADCAGPDDGRGNHEVPIQPPGGHAVHQALKR